MAYPLGVVTQGTGEWQEVIIVGGTWTCPTKAVDGFEVSSVVIEAIGGGQGGRPGTVSVGGNGGIGGHYAKKNTLTVTPGTNYTVTVGAGGGSNANGGDSWFSTVGTVLAKGGGSAATAVGDTLFTGGTGGVGSAATSGGGGGGAGSTGNGGNASAGTAGTGTAVGGAGGGTGSLTAPTGGNIQGGGGAGGVPVTSGAGAVGARGYVVLRYNKYFKPPNYVATEFLTTSQTKFLDMFRSSSAPIILTASTNRYVMPIVKLATLPLTATKQVYVQLLAKVATLPLAAATNRYVMLIAKVATLPLVAVFSRRLEMFRSSSAPIVLTGVMSKALILVRQFVATMPMTAKTAIQMPQDALNRITGGGGTVIVKKIVTYLFDD